MTEDKVYDLEKSQIRIEEQLKTTDRILAKLDRSVEQLSDTVKNAKGIVIGVGTLLGICACLLLAYVGAIKSTYEQENQVQTAKINVLDQKYSDLNIRMIKLEDGKK